MKAKQREEALKHFEELKINHPRVLLPIQAVAWLWFEKRSYNSAVDGLVELVSKTPKPKQPGEPLSEQAREMFYWVGQLREFAAVAVPQNYRPNAQALAALDKALEAHGPSATAAYGEGRQKTASIAQDYDRRISSSTVPADTAKFRIERRRLVNYAEFPFDEMMRHILAGLDQ